MTAVDAITAARGANVASAAHAGLGEAGAGTASATTTGSGVTCVTFTLVADGQTLVDQSFSSAAGTVSFFTDDPSDLGSLTSGPLGGSALTLQATLSVSGASAGSGFYGDMIVGATSATQRFIQGVAGFDVAAGHGETPIAHVATTQSLLMAPRVSIA